MRIKAAGFTIVICREKPFDVAERYYQQICACGDCAITDDHWEIYLHLLALSDDHTAKDIADILGNWSWTEPICNRCQEEDSHCLRITNYSDNTYVDLCGSCIDRAYCKWSEYPP